MTELHYRSLSDICRELKSGAVTSLAVTQHLLDRITTVDPTLKSYVLLLADSALTDAERLDAERVAGKPLGPC